MINLYKIWRQKSLRVRYRYSMSLRQKFLVAHGSNATNKRYFKNSNYYNSNNLSKEPFQIRDSLSQCSQLLPLRKNTKRKSTLFHPPHWENTAPCFCVKYFSNNKKIPS